MADDVPRRQKPFARIRAPVSERSATTAARPIDLSSRRRIRRRRFCSDPCRTQWHRQHREALQAEAADLLQRTLAIIEALAGPRR